MGRQRMTTRHKGARHRCLLKNPNFTALFGRAATSCAAAWMPANTSTTSSYCCSSNMSATNTPAFPIHRLRSLTVVLQIGGVLVAKKRKHIKRKAWTKAHYAELRKHSKAKTRVSKISKLMKRSVGALRQQALKLGIPLGHRR